MELLLLIDKVRLGFHSKVVAHVGACRYKSRALFVGSQGVGALQQRGDMIVGVGNATTLCVLERCRKAFAGALKQTRCSAALTPDF